MDEVEQVEGIEVRIHEDFLYLGNPFVHFALAFSSKAVFLICPVSGDTFLCDVIHSA